METRCTYAVPLTNRLLAPLNEGVGQFLLPVEVRRHPLLHMKFIKEENPEVEGILNIKLLMCHKFLF